MSQSITFTANSMGTAPKDREIMLYVERYGWTRGRWDVQKHNRKPVPFWTYSAESMTTLCRKYVPTAWAEISDMAPALETSKEDQVG